MACITHNAVAYGAFPNSGPVSGFATDGSTSDSHTDGPRPIAVGQTIAAEGKVPGDGSKALGHGDVAVHAGYATLTAKSCTDGQPGRSAQGSALEGTVVVTASPYTVQYQHKSIRLAVSGVDMFTQLRIVQVNVGEFDPRSFPDTGDSYTPLENAKRYLKAVVPPDENLLLVQHFAVDSKGNLTVECGGVAGKNKDLIITSGDFRQSGGTYSLMPDFTQTNTFSIDRPTGEYFIRFQFTWGWGVLPPPLNGSSY